MNIAYVEENSFIYGPGCRFVIWVQGCSIRCKGCWNKDMWSFEKKNELSVDELMIKILEQKDVIEGITLLGGEPLDQYEETFQLLKKSKESNLTTMLFTGYEMSEIVKNNMASIFRYTDILITGRYIEKFRTLDHMWIGSTNQEIHFLSDRYKDYELINSNYVEITIEENGKISVAGFPDDNIKKLL